MSIKLKVKNIGAKAIAFTADDQTRIEIAAGKEADLPLAIVQSAAFAEHVANAQLEIVKASLQGMAANVRAIASQAIADVVLRAAPRFVAHHGQLATALGNLAALRDRYNEQRAATVALLGAAEKLKPGVDGIVKTTALLAAIDDDVVAAADKDLADHLDKVPKKEELAAWYVAHKRLEAARAEAVRMREAAKGPAAKQLDRIKAELAGAATAFANVDPKKDVGAPITWGA